MPSYENAQSWCIIGAGRAAPSMPAAFAHPAAATAAGAAAAASVVDAARPHPLPTPLPPPLPSRVWAAGRGGDLGARAGLLENSGCFVSKCVLWCFVVFCGCFVMFCGCFACFARVLQYFHKTHKTPEKHRKTLENTKNSQYARVLRAFSKSKNIRLYCTKHLSQNI